MSYESSAEPIRLGYLFDFKLPPSFPKEQRDDLTDSFELVFRQGVGYDPAKLIASVQGKAGIW